MSKTKLLQIRLTNKQKRQLDELAKQLKTTKSEVVRDLIETAIESKLNRSVDNGNNTAKCREPGCTIHRDYRAETTNSV